ncbi:adenosylcobinamide amidohydrolase CbiZ2 [Clostridium tetanomorphum DSM 665]|nr:adenosylcobinamide amidohydrolase [Clostridium tetanomorphum]KAJ52356.1 adenosylcobinamide amidohydrolase CbiZ2 [Clostridium tetanomorphum DSM 665]MBP1864809.1 adenosylcobinamide amidohydrolase [Clostridium tetanomorphum]
MIYKLSTGDEVHRYQKSIVVQFKDDRKVLSTSLINGGYKENLKTVFNHDANPGAGMACSLKAPTYKEHMNIIAEELGLDTETTAGISTAASMDNVSIKTESYRDITVTAIVTGGIEVNGGRVGDPGSFYENEGEFEDINPGTINIILYIDADLPAETMTRALVTCTEAKTAAIQELMEGSKYSRGIATGSGTDGTIIVSNSKSKMKLLFSGKHSKLGELIGVAVKKAVKEALFLQTGLCPEKQHSMLRRTKRFGVNEEVIWKKYKSIVKENENGKKLTKAEFIHNLEVADMKDDLVTLTSLYVHLLDQLDWKLLSSKEVMEEGKIILNRIKEKFGVNEVINKEQNINFSNEQCVDKIIEFMIDNLITVMAHVSGGFYNV